MEIGYGAAMDAKPISSDWEDEPDIFDQPDEAAEEAADREAQADYAAGRVVPHAEVANGCVPWARLTRSRCRANG